MSGKSINFGDNQKKWILQKQKVNSIDDNDANKVLVSKKKPCGTKNSFKYFIGYNDNDVIIFFYILLDFFLFLRHIMTSVFS